MLHYSHRALHMPASPIRKLVPYADLAKERGINIHHLNIGQPDIQSPESAISALNELSVDILSYTHSEGTLQYREAMSKYYRNRGYDIAPNQIITTTGGSEALLFTFNIIANVGDEVIIPEPFYANYNGFSQQTGVHLVPVKSDISDGFALPDIESFRDKINERTRAILICNPGNPTGYVYRKEELNKLKELVLEYDLYLISDEVYAEFVYDDLKFHSILGDEDLTENAIVIDSESKRFSMCGARIGAVISRNQYFLDYAIKFAQTRLSPVFSSQLAAAAAHQNPTQYLSDAKTEYKNRRDFLVDALNEIPGVICPKPKGAFYCMIQLPVDNTDHFAQWLLEDFQLDGETLMVAPGNGFYSDEKSGLNEVRLAYVLKTEDLKKSVAILKAGLEKYPG